ncbi:MAG: hypothetical protein RIC53_07905 [Cyclobacteriaceae bacterium]
MKKIHLLFVSILMISIVLCTKPELGQVMTQDGIAEGIVGEELTIFKGTPFVTAQQLAINDLDYFDSDGLNVLVLSNEYNDEIFEEKTAGIELIHHRVITVTGITVILNNTLWKWDLIPEMTNRTVDKVTNVIEVEQRCEAENFDSRLKETPKGTSFLIAGLLDQPVLGNNIVQSLNTCI